MNQTLQNMNFLLIQKSERYLLKISIEANAMGRLTSESYVSKIPAYLHNCGHAQILKINEADMSDNFTKHK